MKLEDLEFVILKIPRCIPVELINSVKGRTFTPEQFYAYQEANVKNPNNYLYVLVDSGKKIHGYLWFEQNSLDKSIFINTFSIDKAFWGKGAAIHFVVDFMKGLKKRLSAHQVIWCTTNPNYFKFIGFKASKQVLMVSVEET